MSDDFVTVIYFWKIKQRKVGFALLRMALDRGGLRRLHGVRFAKMLGSGKGETFTPRDADITRWGALIVIEQSQLAALDNSKLIKRWRTNSSDEVRYLVDPNSVMKCKTLISFGINDYWSFEKKFLKINLEFSGINSRDKTLSKVLYLILLQK